MVTDSEAPGLTYTTLKPGEIRLLSPVDADNGLVWSLKVEDFNSGSPSYDALSYTWGPQANTFPIRCNGKVMRVHHNLFSALPFLARRTGELTSRPIWVDAVCINQADDDEKLTQIRMMNTIYRKAAKVWVWLGLAPTEIQEQISHAVTLLPHISEERMRRQDLGQAFEVGEVVAPLRSLEPLVWKAIFHLLRNSYFQRVWVVQEAALAKDITFLCGKFEIDFEVLRNAIDNDFIYSWKLRDVHGDPVPCPIPNSDRSTLFHIRERVRREGTKSGTITPRLLLTVAILMSREHDCFNAQDRVFGTLGLVKEEDLASTGFELRTCTTVQDLYTQYGAYILLNNDPNTVENWWKFFNSAFTFNKPAGLPSWIPDLHHQRRLGTGSVGETRGIDGFMQRWPLYKRYQASRRPTVVCKGSHLGEIILRGKIMDDVVLTHPTPPNMSDNPDDDTRYLSFLIQLADWEKKVAGVVLGKRSQDNTESLSSSTNLRHVSEETYWRTLLADNLTDMSTGSEVAGEHWRTFHATVGSVKKMAQRVLERIAKGLDRNIDLSEEDLEVLSTIKTGTPTHSFMCALLLLKGRQLFNTARGRFGFAIKGVKPGDVVCVFNTASTPHVLRKIGDGESDVYCAIGDAYVHSLMYGQADEMDIEERDIVLV